MRGRAAIFVMFLTVLLMFPSGAKALLVESVGEPYSYNSWGQGWRVGGAEFNRLELSITNEPGFEEAGFKYLSNFSIGGWSANLLSSTHLVATGSLVDIGKLLSFDSIFTLKPDNQRFSLGFNVYRDHDFLGSMHQWLDKKYFSPDPPSAVPEPSTFLLVGFGLMGVAGYRRKFRK